MLQIIHTCAMIACNRFTSCLALIVHKKDQHSCLELFIIDFNHELQAKHVHLDVQRIALRCLGLFGLLEKKPSKELVKQLRLSFVKGPAPISIMACKALIDLGMWHNPHEIDRAYGVDLSSQLQDDEIASSPATFFDLDENLNVKVLNFLYAGLVKDDWPNHLANDDNETVQAVLGEGFAKILLLSENFPSLPNALHTLVLTKLIHLYFGNEAKNMQRYLGFSFPSNLPPFILLSHVFFSGITSALFLCF